MTLLEALGNFKNSIVEANSLIALAFQQDSSTAYVLPEKQREYISNAAFLQVFIAWETFLESSFIAYMLGEPSITGKTIPCFSNPKNENHARMMLIGTQRYIDWGNANIVKTLSELYFDVACPHNIFVSSAKLDLDDLRTVRNAAAHLTSITGPKLDSLGERRLNKPCSQLKVSDFIFTTDPTSASSETVLSIYLQKLDICAEGIANG